jgi:SAM-dependent methyltransferase
MAPETALFLKHWIEIDPQRLARYETMYQWSAAAEAFYTPAEICAGQLVVDFGCGPGYTAVEFARRVGPTGHVHALDINAEFIRRAQARAKAAGFADRITAQLLTDERLPFAAAAVDRITARNTIIYVRDPVSTFKEFRRVLKPGGIAHAIEGDWSLDRRGTISGRVARTCGSRQLGLADARDRPKAVRHCAQRGVLQRNPSSTDQARYRGSSARHD